jgi:tRNA/tmRNA/rRNA uracil-C5-methylase (TrmA/RlmC/RlmD family)
MVTTEKKDFLFRFVQTDIRKQLKLDEEALFSTTDQVTADKITKDILRFVPRKSTITDATACIGGSAYSFIQNFSNVIAIEYDKKRFEYLQHNMSILPIYNNSFSNISTISNGSSHSNISNSEQINGTYNNIIECRNGDAIIECTKQYQEAIFIDPPWGGPEYKMLPSVQLYLSGLPLSEVCRKICTYTTYIILKVPVNFDEESFILDTYTFMEQIYKNSQLRKMHLLIFKSLRI